MKAKSKIIVSAILAIALCVSLIAGTTFALFTSEDSVNIAVTAGNVEVEAGLSLVSTASDGVTNATVGSFATGGTAKVVGKELTLSNVVPGDSATVKISLTNKSTVAISYRVNVAIKGKLAEVLTVSGVQDGKGEWKKLGAKEAIEDGIDLTVAFPHGDNDNKYMGERGSVTITVEAVQGNAAVEQVYVSNADELIAALNNTELQVIGLKKGVFDLTVKGLAITRPVTLIGAGEGTVIKVGSDSISNAVSKQAYLYIKSSDVTLSDMTIESVQTADATQSGSKQFVDTVKVSSGRKDATTGEAIPASNVTISNVNVIGETNNGINLHKTKDVTLNNVSVSGTMHKCAVAIAESENAVLRGCSLPSGEWGAVGVMYEDTYKSGSSVTLEDCEVGHVYAEHPAGQSDINTIVGLEDRDTTVEREGTQTYYVPVANLNGVKYKSLQEAISNANNGDVITLSSGTFAIPTDNSAVNKTVTIVGAGTEATVIDRTAVTAAAGLNLTVKNATIKGVNDTYKGIQHDESETYIDCVIENQVFLYAENVTFVNCVFNQSDSNSYNVWTYGAQKVKFDNCVFNTAHKAVLVYNENGAETKATFDKCTFNSTWTGAAKDMKAAVEVHTEKFIDTGKKFTVTLNQCTYTENTFSALVLDNNPGCGCADITVVK